MKAQDIRQSFLDFFESKKHQVVQSASLLPESPNLLFTNAGMNQFVPYFLGDQKAPFIIEPRTPKNVFVPGANIMTSKMSDSIPTTIPFPKCSETGRSEIILKRSDRMGWELLVDIWNFPANRLYATVYKPETGDPAEFDQEAYDFWSAIFEKAGLDPKIHVVTGGKKDNFWMMGETGPCGPCSELHIDLTPDGDTQANS